MTDTTPPPAPAWQARALAATTGTKFGAILRCALDVEPEAQPRYIGRASVTSGGLLVCDFVDEGGQYHAASLIGSAGSLDDSVEGLAERLGLAGEDLEALQWTIAGSLQVTLGKNDPATSPSQRTNSLY